MYVGAGVLETRMLIIFIGDRKFKSILLLFFITTKTSVTDVNYVNQSGFDRLKFTSLITTEVNDL